MSILPTSLVRNHLAITMKWRVNLRKRGFAQQAPTLRDDTVRLESDKQPPLRGLRSSITRPWFELFDPLDIRWHKFNRAPLARV